MTKPIQKEFGQEKPYEGYWKRVDNNTSEPICIHHKMLMIFHPKALVDFCPLCQIEIEETMQPQLRQAPPGRSGDSSGGDTGVSDCQS